MVNKTSSFEQEIEGMKDVEQSSLQASINEWKLDGMEKMRAHIEGFVKTWYYYLKQTGYVQTKDFSGVALSGADMNELFEELRRLKEVMKDE